MIRAPTFVAMLVFVFAGLFLYQTKHRSQVLERDIAQTLKQIDQARQRTVLLRAEYTLLNDPSRLQDLSDQWLKLQPTAPGQFTTMADLDRRLPPVGPLPSVAPDPTEPPTETPAPMAQAAPAPAPPVAKPQPAPRPAPVAIASAQPPPFRPAPRPPEPARVAAVRPVALHPVAPPPVQHVSAPAPAPAPPRATPVFFSALGMARTMPGMGPAGSPPGGRVSTTGLFDMSRN